MADPSSEDHRLLIRDMDAIAVRLKRLADARVPVLWRPLHEAEGGWFWWGAKGPEPAKQLCRLLHDRLVHHHGLHNLIWVWELRRVGALVPISSGTTPRPGPPRTDRRYRIRARLGPTLRTRLRPASLRPPRNGTARVEQAVAARATACSQPVPS